jgi:hypothetical protein
MADEQDDKSPADDKSKSPADDKAKADEKSPADATDKSPADESISLDEARKLRREAQSLRKRLADVEADQKKAKDAELSETERLKKQLKEAEDKEKTWAAERRERDARDTVLAVLTDESDPKKPRAKSPNAARTIFKLVKDELEYDDKGEILNLSSVLHQAKKDYGDLFAGKAAGSADGGAGAHSANGAGDMNAQIRRMAGR